MNKICIITGAWKRHKVLAAALGNWLSHHAVEVVVAYSPGDPQVERTLRTYGVRTVKVANRLGEKFNAATRAARQVQADYYLHMGSDDLVDDALWAHYANYQGTHMGLLDWYFHYLPTGATRYWPGYTGAREGEPIGAGKLVRRDVMEAIGWQPFDAKRPNALDYDQHHKLTTVAGPADLFRLRDLDAVGVDLKDDQNLTSWPRILPTTEACTPLAGLAPTIWNDIHHLSA